MKMKISVIVAFISIISVAAIYAQTYPEGIVSAWKFDEGNGTIAYDSIDYNDGNIVGPTWELGKCDTGLIFDGIDDYVTVTDTSDLSSDSVSISLWINVQSIPSRFAIFTKHERFYGRGILLIVQDGTLVWAVNRGGTGNYANWCWVEIPIGDAITFTDTWYHFVGTYDSETGLGALYRNGELLGFDDSISGAMSDNDQPIRIGKIIDWGGYFNGLIDEVSFYNRALSQGEAQYLYQEGLCGCIRQVSIDIKPGNDPNSINLCSNGVVPIAILGSDTFNVLDVNTENLRFAEAAVKVVGKKDPHSLCSYKDVNGDSIDDLVCNFLTADIAGIDGESTSATVNGELLDGTPFEGTDSVNIVKDTCN